MSFFREFMDRQLKWDRRFVEVARGVSSWSKDPSTKVGVALTNQHGRVIATGYNGFARGVADTEERLNDRPTKYELVVHAEANAIVNCAREGVSTMGSTLYVWPGNHICNECAKLIIQAGIIRTVGPRTDAFARWGTGRGMLQEAGVEIDYIEMES